MPFLPPLPSPSPVSLSPQRSTSLEKQPSLEAVLAPFVPLAAVSSHYLQHELTNATPLPSYFSTVQQIHRTQP